MIPELLQHYDKILYLDADMVVTSDVAELYQEDIAGYLLAACKDPDTMGLYNGWQEDKKEYMDHVLKIKDPYSYFQAGVLLMNLQELRQQYSTKDLLTIATEYEWQLLDQDVLNKVAQGKVKFVDMKWNVMYDWRGKRVREIISKAPVWIQKEYLQARKNATIIHYAGDVKPWQDMTCDFGWVFWKYARESAYYENLVSNVIKHVNTSNIKKTYYVEQIRPKLLILFNALFPRYSARRQYIRKMWNAVTKR
jgi:lipopolysaccharide biosynthesis glycosyltransferase